MAKSTMLTVAQAAERMGVSRPVAYRLIASGEITRYKIGGCVRVKDADVDAYIEASRTPSVAEELAARGHNATTMRRERAVRA